MVTTLPPGSKWRIVDGRVECQRGHVIADDGDVIHVQGRRKCRRCHSDRNARSRRRVHAAAAAARTPWPCRGCGVPIRRLRFCSRACCAREHTRIWTDRERAQQAGVRFEPVHRIQVYERDSWLCRLCGLPVPWFLEWPHDWSPVLDHRLPLAQGGDHVEANVQLAHAICNAWKRDMGPAEFAQALIDIGLERWEMARA